MNHQPPERGPCLILEVAGVFIYLHWSFLAVGVGVGALLAFLAGRQPIPVFTWSTLACAAVVAIHELGHAVAARAMSCKVHAIAFSGAGGWCFADHPASPKGKIAFFSAGIVAQALLFVMTVLTLWLYGAPSSLPMTCCVIVFTAGNLLIAAPNLIPRGANDAAQITEALADLRAESRSAGDA